MNDEPSIKRADFTEQHHFILEAAMQLGFDPIDDAVTLFEVTDEWIVEFATRVADSAIAQYTTKIAEAVAEQSK